MVNDSILGRYLKVAKTALGLYGIPKNLLSRLFSAYFIVSALQLISARKQGIAPIAEWKDFVAEFPLGVKIMWIISAFLWLSILYRVVSEKCASVDQIALISGSVLLSLCIVWRSDSFYLGAASAVVSAVFVVYAMGKINQDSFERLSGLPAAIIVFATAAAVIFFIAATTVAIHRNFGTSCFDTGIFVQTFYSLKEHFTAVVTCERDEFMSHFRIHSSYIFYLFLPIYALFPNGETLLTAQAFFAIAGVVPLYLIAKKHGFKGFTLVSMCFVYIFYCGLVMPCYFQFHENAFLPTILMWLLYAMDQRNIPLFYIMSVLTCMVKEDAPLYVVCIAVFFIFEEKGAKKKHGFIISALSAVYFILIVKWLGENGDGQFMTSSRLGALMIDQSDGIAGVIRNVLANPGYFISLLLQERTLLFFVQTMLPLLFLPFLTKKLHRFLLMIPYVIMNLVIGAGYVYAGDIGFQYIFGPACLLIYMALRNVEELPKERRNMLVTAAAVVAAVTTVSMASGRISAIEQHNKMKEYYDSAEECIQSVPENASVLANSFLLPHAANRDEIYELDDGCFAKDDSGEAVGIIGLEKYDFCVFSNHDPLTERARPFLEAAGWTVYAESDESFVVVFVSPEYSGAD